MSWTASRRPPRSTPATCELTGFDWLDTPCLRHALPSTPSLYLALTRCARRACLTSTCRYFRERGLRYARSWWIAKLPPPPPNAIDTDVVRELLESALGTPRGASFVRWLNRVHRADPSVKLALVQVVAPSLPPELADAGAWLRGLWVPKTLHGDDAVRFLPPGLVNLYLRRNELVRVPAALSIARLDALWLDHNRIQVESRGSRLPLPLHCAAPSPVPPATHTRPAAARWPLPQDGWQHIPGCLRELHLYDCGLRHVPAELAELAGLQTLWLGRNAIEGGWHHLPRQLRDLSISQCGLRHLPTELAALARLERLFVDENRQLRDSQQHGWRHVSPQLNFLRVDRSQLSDDLPETNASDTCVQVLLSALPALSRALSHVSPACKVLVLMR